MSTKYWLGSLCRYMCSSHTVSVRRASLKKRAHSHPYVMPYTDTGGEKLGGLHRITKNGTFFLPILCSEATKRMWSLHFTDCPRCRLLLHYNISLQCLSHLSLLSLVLLLRTSPLYFFLLVTLFPFRFFFLFPEEQETESSINNTITVYAFHYDPTDSRCLRVTKIRFWCQREILTCVRSDEAKFNRLSLRTKLEICKIH